MLNEDYDNSIDWHNIAVEFKDYFYQCEYFSDLELSEESSLSNYITDTNRDNDNSINHIKKCHFTIEKLR